MGSMRLPLAATGSSGVHPCTSFLGRNQGTYREDPKVREFISKVSKDHGLVSAWMCMCIVCCHWKVCLTCYLIWNRGCFTFAIWESELLSSLIKSNLIFWQVSPLPS